MANVVHTTSCKQGLFQLEGHTTPSASDCAQTLFSRSAEICIAGSEEMFSSNL